MKRILFVLSMMISVAYGQSVGQIRYDTTKFLKVGGYNEVKIQNSTKDSVGGLFTNVGNGWGKWMPPRSSGDTLFIGLDTVLVGSSITASQGLTKSTNDIQLGSATQNASVFTSDRYINTNGRNLWLTSRTTSMQIGVDSSVAGGAAFIYLKGPYGGQINFFSDTTARTFNGMAWYKGGTLKGSFGNDVGPTTNHFFFDASDDANGFLSYNWEWGGLSHMVIYRTGMQYFAQRGVKRAHFGAATEPGQTLVVTGSQLVTDTAHFAKKMFITDSTGYDIMMSARATPYETKMMTIADLATLVGGSSGLTVGTTTITSGTDTRVPFNDAGVYNEDAGIVYNKTTDKLTVGSTIGIEPGSGTATLSLKSSAGAFTSTLVYDASRNCIWDYRDGVIIRVNGNNIGSWISTGLSVNGGGGTAADFTVRSTTYNPFFLVDVSADKISIGAGSTPTHTVTLNGQLKVWAPQAGDAVPDSVAVWKDGVLSAGTTITSGTYTPTLTNETNLDGSTAYDLQYLRVGNTVTVSGKVDVDPTASTVFTLGISLPFASNFSTNGQGNGTGREFTTGQVNPAVIFSDATNDRVSLQMTTNSTSGATVSFSFTYQII